MKRSHSQILILSSEREMCLLGKQTAEAVSLPFVCTSHVNNFHLDMSYPHERFK